MATELVAGLAALAAGAAVATAGALRARRAETAYPPIGAFVSPPGERVRLHYLERGPRSDRAVILLHGASGNLRDFAFDFMDRFADSARVIAFDRPGHGYSSRGDADAHRPDVQARMLRAGAAALGVRKAVLVGHSFGAAPALAWALDAPDMALGVVNLAGASHPWPGGVGALYTLGAVPVLGRLVAAAAALSSETRVRRELPRIFAPQPEPEGFAEFVGLALALRPQTLRWNAQDIARLHDYLTVQAARYPTLKAPIESLHGDQDVIVGADYHAAKLTRAAPNARFTRLPGVGHMPHHAEAEACAASAQRLLAAGA